MSVAFATALPEVDPGEAKTTGAADEAARAWLARELHDGVVQRLTLMVVEIELLKRRTDLADLDPLQQTARAAVADLRHLLCELRDEPAMDGTFIASVRELLSEFQSQSAATAELTMHSWPEELPHHTASNLCRIIGEALTNVRRHSGARRVEVTLQVVDNALAVTVADDGRGMQDGEPKAGFGVRGMRERVSILGGRLTIDSRRRQGTTLRCIVPMGWLR